MLKNYFKVAYRNLLKNKAFSFINLLGLAVGMASFFLIYLYVDFELSYDRFNKKADRIYRLVCDIKTPSETLNIPVTSGPMGLNIKADLPEVEDAVRINMTSLVIRKDDIKIQEERCVYTDPSIFSIFDFPLLQGNPKTALKDPFAIVISETTAKKYFGSANPLGQTLILGSENYNVKVTGVMKDIPENSQFKANMFISMETYRKSNPNRDTEWGNFGITTYLLLRPGSKASHLEAKLPQFLDKYIGKEMKEDQMHYSLLLEPLGDVYLKSKRGGFETGNINNVYIFSVIGIFILIIACINFINLTTARSSDRAKEVGIKKVVGAGKLQLARQFLLESMLICLVSFILAVILSVIFLPLFNQLSGKIISTGVFTKPASVFLLLIIAMTIGFLAGIYPALVLSSFKPIAVLKGRFSTGTKGVLLRKGLVIAQFTISIAMIVGTIIVYFQLHYMRNQDLGFSKDQMMIIESFQDGKKEAFKQEISKLPGVVSASLASSIPGGGNPGAYSEVENKSGDMQVANLDLYLVDFDYINLYNMKVIAGRGFSKDFSTDTTQAMVLNESAVKLFGYSSPKEAIGKKFSQWGRDGKIIGVVKDFHFRSLRENIKPLCMRIEPRNFNLITVKITSTNLKTTVAALEGKWEQMIPDKPFTYTFVDEFFNTLYQSEEKFGNLFLNFAILAIFISSLGLLGLALYSTTQRTKEIGIRKVLGASVSNIVHLLSRDFLKLVIYSFIIATPIAWYFMYKWLEDFAYRIEIEWWVFALAGIAAVMVAFFTISFNAVKAAVANPVKSLRTE